MPGHVLPAKDRNGNVKKGIWRIVVEAGIDPATGKRKRIVRHFHGRKSEAEDYMAKLIAELERQEFVEPTKVTVGEWLDVWLNEYKKPPKIRPTTWQNYEMVIRCHIKPAIGHIPLQKLQPGHLQRLYNEKFAQGRVDGKGGLSARTVQIIHTIMHASLKQAMKEGLVARNVSEAATLPKRQKKEPRVLTLEEQRRFLEILAQDRLGAAFLLDLATGLRRGELLALRWQDVDLEEGVVRVSRELVRVKDPETGKSRLEYQPPKSEKGRRSIPLPEWAVAALKAHKARQDQEKAALGGAYQDSGLVFCTELGTPIEPRNLNRKFSQLRRKAGLPEGVTPHGLRHTYATRLLEMNEHPKVVQELLGHSQISVTLDTYSHVLPEIKKAAAAKLNFLWRQEKASSPRTGEAVCGEGAERGASGTNSAQKTGSDDVPEPRNP